MKQKKRSLFLLSLLAFIFILPFSLADLDLSLFYEFNESANATSFFDSSPYNNTGFCLSSNCPTSGVPGPVNTAVSLDGINDNIYTPYDPSLDLGFSGGSVLAWINLDSSILLGQAEDIPILRRRVHPNPFAQGNYKLSIKRYAPTDPQVVDVRFGSHNDVQVVSGKTHIFGDTWNLIGFTYNETNIMVYKNGILETKAARSKNLTYINPIYLEIGYDDEAKRDFFKGSLDEIKVYNRTLSTNEISDLYQSVVNQSPVCGDGIKQPSEACEDGNLNDGDGCSSTCEREEDIAECLDLVSSGKLMIHFPYGNSDRFIVWSMSGKTHYIGASIYEKFGVNLTERRLVNSSIIEIGPYADFTEFLPVPDCAHLSVLHCGTTPIINLSAESYGNRRIASLMGGSGACEETPICGDGILQEGEECEPSLSDNCSQDCKIICIDSDEDGVCDPDDFCPDSLPGEPVDEDGCDIFQFCEVFSCGDDCLYADWRNNEGSDPKDCTIAIRHQNGLVDRPVCVPTEFSDMCAS